MARHVGKFGGVTPPGPKVIGVGTLNFKAFFEFLLEKIVEGTPVPGGVCAIKSWTFSSVYKNLRGSTP